MKTCLIYGQNGLDLDVALNLVAFYKNLGFKTYFSEKLLDANLLVIVRAVDHPLNISDKNYGQVHMYDYGGWGYDACVESLPYEKTYIFTTSEKHKDHIITTLDFPKKQIFIALPPVETKIWVEKSNSKTYDFVHIGNFKKIEDKDEVRERFNQAMLHLNTNIWGMGWDALQLGKKYHGKAGLFDVSKIYSKAKYALGLMYPFQRAVTFSGRFWHAPLNGCYLLSEPGLYSKEFPGIIETNYHTEEIGNLTSKLDDAPVLQQKAIQFWENQKKMHFDLIKSILLKSNFNGVFLLGYFTENPINTLRFYYQKYNLFKYWKK